MGSFYQNKHLGTFGDMGCISFNGNKIITTSGGGAILTHDLKLAMKALHLSTQAKSSPNYNHDAIGYNYRMTGLSAALGLGQLESLNQFLDRKKKINTRYKQALENIEGVEIPKNNERSDPNCWLFAAIVPNVYFLAGSLPKHNIEGRTLWMPLQTLEMFSTSIFITDTNVVSQVFQNALSLPSSTTLTNQEQEYIIDTIAGYLTVK
jgi:dTDP-4-amino-4,6-dideoxygalactose transaminase